MQNRFTRIVLALIAVGTATGCSGQKIETLKNAICCDGGYEYRYRDRFATEKETEARLAALENDRRRLTDELAAAKRETEAVSARTKSLENQLADRDRELAAFRSSAGDSSKLSSQLSSTQAERDRLAAELAASQASLTAVQAGVGDKERIAGELAAAQVAVAALQAGAGDKDKLTAELEQAKKRISELETQLASLNAAGADKDKLAADLAAAQQRNAQLETQVADRDRQLAGLRGDLSTEMVKLKEAERGLIRALRPQIEKGAIMVDLNNERLLINLASAYLFGSGEDQLKSAGADALKQVGAILKDFPEYKVSVDGHTDNRPIRSELKKKFPSNKELSEARATNAALALGEGGLTAVTTHGYADTRPVLPNRTDAERAKNRRVEVLVTK
ncbi:MAG TPA: OmpA family protein [Nitrospira sp.]|nr:OmpA family protein [Nitrospira sp.]